jgi:hypothetical protein
LSGHVFFENDPQGLGYDDTIRIVLTNFPAPQSGKMYTAWLEDTQNHTTVIGQIQLQNGNGTLVYNANQHANLLASTMSVYITQESSGIVPGAPLGDKVYRAMFDPNLLTALQNILYTTTGVPSNQSVLAVMEQYIKTMNDKAGSIADSLQGKDYGLVHRQAVRILELLDGSAYAQASGELPAKDQLLEHNQIGLLSSPTQKGLLDILSAQVQQVKTVANGNNALLQHIQNVENAISDLRTWLKNVHDLDLQILTATDLTIPTVSSATLQLKQAVADSYTGRTIPPDTSPQPTLGSAGMLQAYVQAQYMAELDLQKV